MSGLYYTPLLDDLVALGFDGFVINNNMNLAEIARREVKRCLEDGRPCAGHIIKATADLPHNIPLENIREYFCAADELSRRTD